MKRVRLGLYRVMHAFGRDAYKGKGISAVADQRGASTVLNSEGKRQNRGKRHSDFGSLH